VYTEPFDEESEESDKGNKLRQRRFSDLSETSDLSVAQQSNLQPREPFKELKVEE